MESVCKEIRSDERFNLFDIEYGNVIKIRFAGKCIVSIKYNNGGQICIMNKYFGHTITFGRIYDSVTKYSFDIGPALRNRGYYRDRLLDTARRLDSVYYMNPWITRAGIIYANCDRDYVYIGRILVYVSSCMRRRRLDYNIEDRVKQKLIMCSLPLPIAEEIISSGAYLGSNIRDTLYTDSELDKWADAAIVDNTQTKRTYEKLVRYDAAEHEIANKYPRAAKILPPILTATGYYAGPYMAPFEQIEEYLRDKFG